MDIPTQLYDLYHSFVNDMILKNFGQDCKIQYPDKLSLCPNCYQDTFTNKSSNIYKPGGPVSFTAGICPWCNGEGYLKTEEFDIIKLRIYHSKRNWISIPINVEIPDGTVQVIGFMIDLPKLQLANHILLHIDAEGYTRQRYTVFSEPYPHGLGSTRKYFIAYLRRSG